MQFQPFEPGIEVKGETVYTIVAGFSLFRRLASAVLQSEGLGNMRDDGDLDIDREAWYPQDAWLRAFRKISEEAGPGALLAIGKQIPEHAVFPPNVVDVHSALASVDIAYHLNHRKNGELMFNPESGAVADGIGNYGYERVSDNEVICECRNPYPCDFDRGILTTMARRFAPHAQVAHDDDKPCRKKGDDSCTYVVTW